MSWNIKCCDSECGAITKAGNIVTLLDYNRDDDGYFLCKTCKNRGSIKKEFKTQEKGGIWSPYLRGAIRLGFDGEVYQPFVFIVSYLPEDNPTDAWFSYYKDTRDEGGLLKLGYGPGGPPVLSMDRIKELNIHLKRLKML